MGARRRKGGALADDRCSATGEAKGGFRPTLSPLPPLYQAEAKDGYWNCPCVPMRERHECHCMLFLTADNEFAGDSQTLAVEEVEKYTQQMGSIM